MQKNKIDLPLSTKQLISHLTQKIKLSQLRYAQSFHNYIPAFFYISLKQFHEKHLRPS